jgi:DNA polymerase-3 subunit beta
MHLTVLQENLLKALTHANRAIANRPQLPVLSHLLLTTSQGRLQISATNLEIGLSLWLGVKIEKTGALTLPARLFTEFIASLPPGSVELLADHASLTATSGPHRATFSGLSASEFPPIPTAKNSPDFTLTFAQLQPLVTEVAFATATDDTRPVLTGLLLRSINRRLQAVATDGYRLSLKDLGPSSLSLPDKGLLLPSRALLEAVRIFTSKTDRKITLSLDSNQLIFAGDEAEIVSRLLDGSFPDFEKIIPQTQTTTITLDREELLRAVRLAAVFAHDSANIVKFAIRRSHLTISSTTQQIGNSRSTLDARVVGENHQIAFNARYLLDFLNSTSAEEVTLATTTPLAPGVFRPVGDTSYLHLIMPVRVQE